MRGVLLTSLNTTLADLLDHLTTLVLARLGRLLVASLLVFLGIACYILGLVWDTVWVGGVQGALYIWSGRGVRWVVSLHTHMLTMLGGVVDRVGLVTRKHMVAIQ